MTPALIAAMREHFAAHRLSCRSEWVFHHDRTRRKHFRGHRIRSLRTAVRAAADLAKLPANWHLHDLRHRRVTTWLAEGKDVVKVKEAVGHSDLKTTMGYTHLAREHLRDLVEHKVKVTIKSQSAAERSLPDGRKIMQIRSQVTNVRDLGVYDEDEG